MVDQWNALKSKYFIRFKTDLFFHLFSIVQKQWCSFLALSFRALSRIKNLVPDLGFITSAFQGKNKQTLLVIVIVTVVVFALVGYFAKKVFEPAQLSIDFDQAAVSEHYDQEIIKELRQIYQETLSYSGAREASQGIESVGQDHSIVAGDRNNLGLAWQALGGTQRAIGMFELALASHIKFYGEPDPHQLTLQSRLDSNAETHPKVVFSRNNSGNSHLNIQSVQNNLAASRSKVGYSLTK